MWTKQKFYFLCVLCTLFATTSQSLASPTQGSPIFSYNVIKAQEPSLKKLTDAACEGYGLDAKDTQSWSKKLKASALLPKFYVGFDHQIKNSESVAITDNISTASGVITIGPEDNNIDIDQDTGQVLRLRASWELSDLVFHSNQLALSKHRADLLKLRRALSDEIYDIYEKRYFALKQYLISRKSNANKAEMLYVKFDLLTDRLDELSNGKFHNDFWRK